MMHLADLVPASPGPGATSSPTSGRGDGTEADAFLPQLQELLAALTVRSDACPPEGGDEPAGDVADPASDPELAPEPSSWAPVLGVGTRPGDASTARPLEGAPDPAPPPGTGPSEDTIGGHTPPAPAPAEVELGAQEPSTADGPGGAHDLAATTHAREVARGGPPADSDRRAAPERAEPAIRAVPASPRGDGSDGAARVATPAVPAQPVGPSQVQRPAERATDLQPGVPGHADGVDTAPLVPARADGVGSPGPDRSTSQLVSSAAQRVLEAIELLETAPPPRQLTLELGEVRLRVALEDGQVRLTLLGERSDAADELLREARAELGARGFDLGRQRDGSTDDRDQDQQPHRPTPATPRRSAGLRL